MEKKKQIIFLEPFPEVMIYKIARIFREKGYETISIRILEHKGLSNNFYKSAFDQIIDFNLGFFKINIKNAPKIILSLLKKIKNISNNFYRILKLRPLIIFARANPNLPCAITKILARETPVIYFPYDIRSQCYPTKESMKRLRGLNFFEIASERFCLECSDGIMHKGAPEELNFLENRAFKNLKMSPLRINFLPYCSKEFIVSINKNKLSKKNGEIHLVHIGSSGAGNINDRDYTFKIFKQIINQKIHLHLYERPNTSKKEEVMTKFNEKFKDLNKKYLHLHSPLEPKELIREISKYDFGLYFLNETYSLGDLSPRFLTGNKIASYLEAGIPFFYPDKTEFIDELMKSYSLALPVKNQDYSNIKKTIKKLNYKKLEKNVLKARQSFLMEKNFPRLEEFIQKIVNEKN